MPKGIRPFFMVNDLLLDLVYILLERKNKHYFALKCQNKTVKFYRLFYERELFPEKLHNVHVWQDT